MVLKASDEQARNKDVRIQPRRIPCDWQALSKLTGVLRDRLGAKKRAERLRSDGALIWCAFAYVAEIIDVVAAELRGAAQRKINRRPRKEKASERKRGAQSLGILGPRPEPPQTEENWWGAILEARSRRAVDSN